MNQDGVPSRLARGDGILAREFAFRTADLPDVRDFAAEQARRFGMPEEAVGDFLVAVNEVATNAVTHGAGKARIRLWTEDGLLVVDVHDEGSWTPQGDVGRTAPLEYATSGMGLWVATQLSESIGFDCGEHGTTVTMRFRM